MQRKFFLVIKSQALFERVREYLMKKYTVYTAIFNGYNAEFRVAY